MRCPLLACLLSLPVLSLAQSPTPATHFYVGAGASVLTDIGFRDSSYPYSRTYSPTLVGPALTLGWQFTPALALEVGGAYAWRTTQDTYTYGSYSGVGLVTANLHVHQRVFTLPVLVRYTLTPIAGSLYLDVLGGATMQRATLSYNSSIDENNGNILYTGGKSSLTTAFLTLGPAVRYSLSPRLSLTVDPTLNMALNNSHREFQDRLLWNLRAGVRYSL